MPKKTPKQTIPKCRHGKGMDKYCWACSQSYKVNRTYSSPRKA